MLLLSNVMMLFGDLYPMWPADIFNSALRYDTHTNNAAAEKSCMRSIPRNWWAYFMSIKRFCRGTICRRRCSLVVGTPYMPFHLPIHLILFANSKQIGSRVIYEVQLIAQPESHSASDAAMPMRACLYSRTKVSIYLWQNKCMPTIIIMNNE